MNMKNMITIDLMPLQNAWDPFLFFAAKNGNGSPFGESFAFGSGMPQ